MKKTQTYAILGGTSGIGFALAQRLVARGDRVVIGGRSAEKRATALRSLGEQSSAYAVDMTDRASLATFFAQTSMLAGLFTPAASYTTGAFREGNPETSEALFQAKFWGQYWAVYAALPALLPDAAVVLMSGAASARPPWRACVCGMQCRAGGAGSRAGRGVGTTQSELLITGHH